MKHILSSLVMLLIFLLTIGFTQVPREMNYQGYLTDNSSQPISGHLQLIFKIYDVSSEGTELWSEVHPDVPVINGVFKVQLGSITPIDLPFNTAYWLGIQVESDPELTPRITLSSVGYSFYSMKADSVENLSGTAGGDLSGSYPDPTVTSIQNHAVANSDPGTGQVLKWDGNAWTPSDDNAGTSVWATSGNDIYNTNSDNVGIGTATPGAKLDVTSNSTAAGFKIARFSSDPNTDEFNYIEIGRTSTLDGTKFGYLHHTASSLSGAFVGDSPSTGLFVKSGGRVGIGTTSPVSTLEVQNHSDSPDLRIDATVSGAAYLRFSQDDDQKAFVRINGNGDLQLDTEASGQEAITILNSNANVGIGTPTPGEKLVVNGNVAMSNGYAIGSDAVGLKIVVGEHTWGWVSNNSLLTIPISHGLSTVLQIMISLDTCVDSNSDVHPAGVQCCTFRSGGSGPFYQLVENKSGADRYIVTRWIAVGSP